MQILWKVGDMQMQSEFLHFALLLLLHVVYSVAHCACLLETTGLQNNLSFYDFNIYSVYQG